MFLNRTSTFSCIPACSQPSWSPTSTAICTHIWRLCSYGELKNIQIPTAVCIPRSGPISCHWLAPLHSSAASPFQLCTCTSLACHQSPLLCACSDTQMPQWCTLTAQLVPALAACPSPHHNVCVYNWPLPLHGLGTGSHRQVYGHYLALATTTACPGPLLLHLEIILRTPTAFAASEDPCSISQGPWSCQCHGIQWPEPVSHSDPHSVLSHVPNTWHPHKATSGVRAYLGTFPPLRFYSWRFFLTDTFS